MSAFLRNSGLIILAVLVGAHIAQFFMPDLSFWDNILTPQNDKLVLSGAALLLVLSFVAILFKPVEKAVRSNRCARCGKPIPKGDIYCADHLKEVVDEYREKNR